MFTMNTIQPDYIRTECSSSYYFPLQSGGLSQPNSSIICDKELNNFTSTIVEAEVIQLTGLAPLKKRKGGNLDLPSQKKEKKEFRLDKTVLISLLPINSTSKELSDEGLQTILNIFRDRVGDKGESYGEYLRSIIIHVRTKNSLDEKIIEIGSILLENFKKIKSILRSNKSNRELFLLYKNATKFFYFLSILSENKIDTDKYLNAATDLNRRLSESSFNIKEKSSLHKWRAMINLAKGYNGTAKKNIITAIENDPKNKKLRKLQHKIMFACCALLTNR